VYINHVPFFEGGVTLWKPLGSLIWYTGIDQQRRIRTMTTNRDQKTKSGRKRPRLGRPRADQAGEVEERILQAAELFFLRQGYARTTLEQIASSARIGNTTLYKRYRNKDALFMAVLQRSVDIAVSRLIERPSGVTARQRLREAGVAMGESALTRDVIAIMRISAAEAETFPNVARMGYRLGFDASVSRAAEAIAGSDLPANVVAAIPAATRFVELALHPLELQGMFGGDLAQLRLRIERCVDDAIDVLIRNGLLDGS
jgi:AcrR family transcriptional regulator